MKSREIKGKDGQNKGFKQRVLAVVKSIPEGKTMSYQEVAAAAGSPGAARAVGTIMSRNSDESVPCHRVIRSDGSIGGYNGLRGRAKAELLEREARIQNRESRI